MVGQVTQLLRAFGHALLQRVFGLAQQFVGAPAFGDVDKGGHRTAHRTVFNHRVAAVFGREAAAVGTPQHLVVNAAGQAAAEGVEDGAVAFRVMASVCMGMVHQAVHIAPKHFFGAPTQGLRRGTVDKGAAAFQVDAKHALAGAFQQQGQAVCRRRWHACHARGGAIGVPAGTRRRSPRLHSAFTAPSQCAHGAFTVLPCLCLSAPRQQRGRPAWPERTGPRLRHARWSTRHRHRPFSSVSLPAAAPPAWCPAHPAVR